MSVEKYITLIPGYDPYADAGDCWFDSDAAGDAIDFIETCLKHVKGELAGKPLLLEDWEKAIVANLFGWKRPDGTRRYREALIYVGRKNGKMLDLNTPLPTPDGWTTMGEVRVGDLLFDDNGLPCKAQWVGPIENKPESYEILFSNGEKIKACADHLWLTKARVDKPGDKTSGRTKRPQLRVRTTRELFDTQVYGTRRDRNHSLTMPAALQCAEADLMIEPYFLGCWLGDGTSAAADITASKEDADHYVQQFAQSKYLAVVHEWPNGKASRITVKRQQESLTGEIATVSNRSSVNLQKQLRQLGVLNNKHIPAAYLRASYSQRLSLLQGLLDTDGFISKNGRIIEYTTTSKRLAYDVAELIATMGIKFTSREGMATLDGRIIGPKWRIQFAIKADEMPVFRLDRKLQRQQARKEGPIASRSRTVQITSVRKCDPVPMRCIQVDSPSRLYRCGKTMLPTHNTTLLAAIVCLVMFTDSEPGAELYSAAADRDQATLVFDQVKGMVQQEPLMAERARIYQKSITYEEYGTSYKAISAEANTKHGYNSHLVVVDELHAQPNRELVDVLLTSTGSRRQPLVIHITTADFDRPSICNEKHKYACDVRDGIIKDGYFLPVVYEASRDDDWTAPEVWAKANPCLDVSLSREYIERECKRAQESPAFENTFKRLHLNVRTEQDVRWLRLASWDACGGAIATDLLKGKECIAGLDLGATSDLTSLCLLFPGDDEYRALWWHWVPMETARMRERRDKVPYIAWAKEGWVELTEGNETDYSFIRKRVNELGDTYGIREVAADRLFQGAQLCQDLVRDGFDVVPFGMGFLSMAAPTQELERLVNRGEFRHGDNPVLRWMAANVSVEMDAAGNMKPSKKKSTEKIDGIVSAIMALGRTMAANEPKGSVYEGRGLITV